MVYNGKPYEQMDDFGGIFGNTHIGIRICLGAHGSTPSPGSRNRKKHQVRQRSGRRRLFQLLTLVFSEKIHSQKIPTFFFNNTPWKKWTFWSNKKPWRFCVFFDDFLQKRVIFRFQYDKISPDWTFRRKRYVDCRLGDGCTDLCRGGVVNVERYPPVN